MNDLHEPTNLWESFKQGRPEALRYFFHFHHYRIYCYLQKLPPVKRQVAELYFFQGSSLGAIARHLGLEEQRVKAYISETLKRLGEELEGKRTNATNLSVVRA
jgi:DNA-directed RNA polymerase specialized sigma24 family protein